MVTKRVLLAVAVCVFGISAQQKPQLTIDYVMRGPGLYGYPPQDVRWSGDGKRIYFQWKQAADPQDKP